MVETPATPIAREFLDIDVFKTYIDQLLSITLNAAIKFDLESLNSFISNEEKRALYVHRDYEEERYLLSLDPHSNTALSIIKRFSILDKAFAIQDQVLVINWPMGEDSNRYATMFDYLHYAFAPVFESKAITEDAENKTGMIDLILGLQMTKKKLAELELSLVHLQQNVAIPIIVLKTNPKIQELVQQAANTNQKITTQEMSEFHDSTFLNSIQNDVNSWIKEIQKVTLLTRDPSTGSTRHEIEFWLGMERSLAQIETQLKSPQVLTTLEILKTAKRFHATVSFIADTGIKETSEKVLKYNQLMKDFPINELLAAKDLEKIQDSISIIFAHFNKKVFVY